MNAVHIHWLNIIEQLPGFTGVKGSVGQQDSWVYFEGTEVEVVADKGKSADNDEVYVGLGEEAFNNEVKEGISAVVNFMDSIDN